MQIIKKISISILTIVVLSLALGAGLAGLSMVSSQIALSTALPPPTDVPGWPGAPGWTKWPLWLALWSAIFIILSTLVFYERPSLETLSAGKKVAFYFFWAYMIGIGLVFMTVYLSLMAALPAGLLLYLSHEFRYTTWFPQTALAASGALAVAVSSTMIRRAFGQARLARSVENIATSRARSAAAGLVELTGTAQSISSANAIIHGQWGDRIPESSVSDFRVRDQTGEILVAPGEKLSVIFDDGVLLKWNGPNRRILESGDDIYVMGRLEPAASESGEPRIRPMPLPGGFALDRLLDRGLESLNHISVFYFVMLLHRIIPSPFLFVVSNLGEKTARRMLRQRRWTSLLLGAVWFASGFLMTVTGLAGLFDDGVHYLNHFVWFFSWGSVF